MKNKNKNAYKLLL